METKKLIDSFGRTAQERADQKALMDAANKEAAENWTNPEWRREFAAALTESILLGFEFETLVNRFINTDTVGFNDRVLVKETKGLKAYFMARGGYIEASELHSEVTEVPRDMIGAHVYEFEDKFLTNFSETAQDLRNACVQRIDAEVNRRVHTVLATAIDAASPYYLDGPSIDKAVLDQAIREVRDASRTGEVVIWGRSTTVDQIMDFDGFGNETQEEIRQKGILGVYRGAPIVQLKNYTDEDDVAFIPANELWVTSRDMGKFAFFGGLQSKEYSEQDNWYWHYVARRDSGCLVHKPERARRLIDTSIS